MAAKKRTHFPGRYNDWPKRLGERKQPYKARRRLAARDRGFIEAGGVTRRGYHRPGSNKK